MSCDARMRPSSWHFRAVMVAGPLFAILASTRSAAQSWKLPPLLVSIPPVQVAGSPAGSGSSELPSIINVHAMYGNTAIKYMSPKKTKTTVTKTTTPTPSEPPKPSPKPKPKPAPKPKAEPEKTTKKAGRPRKNKADDAPSAQSREELLKLAAADFNLEFVAVDVHTDTEETVTATAHDAAQVHVAYAVESTARRAECIAALKQKSGVINDFLRDIAGRASLGLTPLEELYYKQVEAHIRKAIGRFLMQTEAEFEDIASQLRPTASPADVSAAVDLPADPTDDPKDLRTQMDEEVKPHAAIMLGEDVEYASQDMVYVPNPHADPAIVARLPRLTDPTPLPDAANVDQYLTFRKEIKTWLKVAAEDGYAEMKILGSLIRALPEAAKSKTLNFFPNYPSEATVSKLFAYLDSEYRLNLQRERTNAIQEFKEMSRGNNETLTQLITRFATLLERAQRFGFSPDTEIADTLLKIAKINALNRTDLIAKWGARKDELEAQQLEADYAVKLKFYYKYLRDLGSALDQGVIATTGPVSKVAVAQADSDTALAGAKKGSKKDAKGRRRSRSRGPKKGPEEAQVAESAKPAGHAESAAAAGAQGKTWIAPEAQGDPAFLSAMMQGLVLGQSVGAGKNPMYNQQYHSNYKGNFGKNSWYTPPKGNGKGKGKLGKHQQWSKANVNPSPVPPRGWGADEHDWKCTCGYFNFAIRNTCNFCGKAKIIKKE